MKKNVVYSDEKKLNIIAFWLLILFIIFYLVKIKELYLVLFLGWWIVILASIWSIISVNYFKKKINTLNQNRKYLYVFFYFPFIWAVLIFLIMIWLAIPDLILSAEGLYHVDSTFNNEPEKIIKALLWLAWTIEIIWQILIKIKFWKNKLSSLFIYRWVFFWAMVFIFIGWFYSLWWI